MPAKKHTVTTTSTESNVSNTNVTKSKNTQEVTTTPAETQVNQSESYVEANATVKKPARRAGRTLIVKSLNGTISENQFSFLTGLESVTGTKSNASYFLQFNTVNNAVNAFRQLRTENSSYRMKFSYYRVFFTINGLTESTDYNHIKQTMSDYVEANTSSHVIYSKFYRKDGKFIGCGDLTVDTLQGMNTLLTKESGFKEFSFGGFTGTFYRFNNRQEKTNGASTTA